MLQFVAACCSVLPCVCSVLQRPVVRCSVLQRGAVRCSALRCVAAMSVPDICVAALCCNLLPTRGTSHSYTDTQSCVSRDSFTCVYHVMHSHLRIM